MKRSPGPVNEKGLTLFERLMRHYRYTQRDLAKVTGVSKTTVQRIAKGDEPRVTSAIKIARAFKITVEDLWGKDLK